MILQDYLLNIQEPQINLVTYLGLMLYHMGFPLFYIYYTYIYIKIKLKLY